MSRPHLVSNFAGRLASDWLNSNIASLLQQIQNIQAHHYLTALAMLVYCSERTVYSRRRGDQRDR